jgi:hypothetical protein
MEKKYINPVLEHISLQQIEAALNKRGFNTVILNSKKEVKDFLNKMIPDTTPVGLGDSITTCKLNLRNLLAAKGATIFYSWNGSENYNRSIDTFDTPVWPKYYITRITALSLDGRLLMKDYQKRAAAENKFPANVYAFVGLNRLVEQFFSEGKEVKYPVIPSNPPGINFTVALLPFLDY